MFGKFFHNVIGLLKKNKPIINNQLEKLVRDKISKLQSILGFTILDQTYYVKAITHRSFIELYPDLVKSNQRLEFFGDSVINMIVAQYLFDNFPDEEEGFLTKARASLVNKDRLYEAAKELNLDEVILYNVRYLKESVIGLQSILADVYEALTGAIFLDQGLNRAHDFVHKTIIQPLEKDETFLEDTNYKGLLLEYTHAHKLTSPKYIVRSEEGPPHMKEFTIEVFVNDESYGVGTGNNKKNAEQNASKVALGKLKIL